MSEFSNHQILEILREIARVASVMFDGELCSRIFTGRAMEWLGKEPDPGDRFAIGDNIDFDASAFEEAKKDLLRLQRLAPEGLEVQCLLWVPVRTRPGTVTVAVFNGGPSRWWHPMMTYHETTDAMKAALETGYLQEVPPEDSKVLAMLAPVRDSLKEVTGLIEVSASGEGVSVHW